MRWDERECQGMYREKRCFLKAKEIRDNTASSAEWASLPRPSQFFVREGKIPSIPSLLHPKRNQTLSPPRLQYLSIIINKFRILYSKVTGILYVGGVFPIWCQLLDHRQQFLSW